jgi:hypothetical protein
MNTESEFSHLPDELRILILIALPACVMAAIWSHGSGGYPSDLSFLQAGARGLLHGVSPYAVVGPDGSPYVSLVGPGGSFAGPFHLRYPLTAVIATVPFAPFSLRVADLLWAGLSTAALWWALTFERVWHPRLAVFGSAAFVAAILGSQWSPFLIFAALTPAFGFLLVAKPTIGAALWLAYPSRRAIIGSLIFVGLAFAIRPSWFGEWRQAVGLPQDMMPPILRPGGALVLMSLVAWRRPEARLLAALACLPQTPLLYEAVPLFLIPRRWHESLYLAGATFVVFMIVAAQQPYPSYEAWTASYSRWIIWLLYLPCTLMVLREWQIWHRQTLHHGGTRIPLATNLDTSE